MDLRPVVKPIEWLPGVNLAAGIIFHACQIVSLTTGIACPKVKIDFY